MTLARLAGQAGRAQVPPAVRPGVTGGGSGGEQSEEKFELLAKYIPAETITLFVAAISAMQAIVKLEPEITLDPWVAYWLFAVLTPLTVLVLAYGAYKEAARARKKEDPAADPPGPFKWPLFRMAAAAVAFLVWALAVPGLVERPVWQIVAGFGALLVSTALSMIERMVGP